MAANPNAKRIRELTVMINTKREIIERLREEVAAHNNERKSLKPAE